MPVPLRVVLSLNPTVSEKALCLLLKRLGLCDTAQASLLPEAPSMIASTRSLSAQYRED